MKIPEAEYQPTVEELQTELRKRLSYPECKWERQTDFSDHKTNFVYQCFRWQDLVKKVSKLSPELRDYAVNRWFNFWSARGVEQIFCQCIGIQPIEEKHQYSYDFTIGYWQFDHKTSVFPRAYKQTPDYAWRNPDHLLKWFYLNQSRGQRWKLNNRLFLVLYDEAGSHWRLKADLSLIQEAVAYWAANFAEANLRSFTLEHSKITAGLIWITNPPGILPRDVLLFEES